MSLSATGRSAVTLVVLAVLFLGGITWAWSRVTEPFPEAQETPLCTDTTVSAGSSVRPGQVLVSVLNASGRNGLAGETMDALVERGFGKGESGNVSVAGAKTLSAQIWTSDRSNPSVALVRSYLGKGVEIVDQEAGTAGVTVVVGERFDHVTKGRKRVKATEETTVCAPVLVAEETP
ncbi:LytR C-terminal domain-containing protein [Nocardioides sambongensis]|uniref:LytR C-terminal domain-containing protein n=1 Tax=Nocardioides sambongensis TaxID=2589074 RepID=UPI00112E3548|nr:LytR C-terminal domain-containing protein [Nocardioides sambongensis]